MESGMVQIYFACSLFEQQTLLLILSSHLFLRISKQNPAYILCFYMFYVYLSGFPGFSYFETKNVKIINNFLISGTQLSLHKSVCIYGLFFNAVIIRREQIKDDVMDWVLWPAWLKRKCIQVSGKKNMKEWEHFEDLRIDRMNTVSSGITSDLLTQIGYNMIDGHGMKPTTCLQPVLRLRKNVTIPLLPLYLHTVQTKVYFLSLKHEARIFVIALH